MSYLFPPSLPADYRKKAQTLNINESEIIEQFIRGSGPGGQKINKTSSAVLLRYPPMGIEIRCQKHREQSKNRLSAAKILINKIELKIRGEKSALAQKIFKLRKQKQKRSKRAKEKILAAKKIRGELKKTRASINQIP